MKKKLGLVILAVVAVTMAVLGCGGQNTSQTPTSNDTVEQTPEQIYARNCASCHGGNLQGSFGPPLKGTGAKYSEQEILSIITNGKGSMPAQNYVDKEHQQKLAKWLSENK
ncbi:cytochrome c [Hazenella sp. IB182357]|uniref:Cytochrome c n=1 Tax=Polycladospora coralii TaxID=2771432 RepID=A0A926RTE0_9BACL|nr:cytochrome c [Polycladospora coralii]MBD1371578.1 cytochrome c [Polycladospora coralii]